MHPTAHRRTSRWLLLCAALALALPAWLPAQSFAGGWRAALPNGNTLSLTLAQTGASITGTLTGSGTTLRVQAQADGSGSFVGTAASQQGSVLIAGEFQGAALHVVLAEMTAAGTPNMASASEVMFQRGAGAEAAPPVAANPKGSRGSSPAPAPGGGGAMPGAMPGGASGGPGNAIAESPADRQLAQLLLSSRWCYMRYSSAMGATTTEKVAFAADGTLAVTGNRETNTSNQYGSYYGNSGDTQRAYWRVRNGQLLLSQDGSQWEGTPLSVAPNSNGAPIVTANGKEYSRCD